MLNLLRAVPEPQPGRVEVVGIDDFALRRGHVYGTVVLDMRTRRLVDVLPGRDAEPVAQWLRNHPEVRIVCRDRASAYANPRELHQTGDEVADGALLLSCIAEDFECQT